MLTLPAYMHLSIHKGRETPQRLVQTTVTAQCMCYFQHKDPQRDLTVTITYMLLSKKYRITFGDLGGTLTSAHFIAFEHLKQELNLNSAASA